MGKARDVTSEGQGWFETGSGCACSGMSYIVQRLQLYVLLLDTDVLLLIKYIEG